MIRFNAQHILHQVYSLPCVLASLLLKLRYWGSIEERRFWYFFLPPSLSFLPFAWEGLGVKYMINQNRPQFYSPLYSLLEQRAYIFIYSRHFEFKMTNYKFFEWSAENQNGNAVDEEVFFTIHQSVLLTLQYMSISQTQLDQEKSFQIINC